MVIRHCTHLRCAYKSWVMVYVQDLVFGLPELELCFLKLCKVICYFLDVPGLFCVFPGVEVDVSWSCTGCQMN